MTGAPATGRAVVVGAGITGLATACRLAEEGYDVTVIEAAVGPGLGASRANAGQLLFDRVSATGSPGFLKSLPRTLTDKAQGISVLGLASPANWRWGLAFLGQCNMKAWRHNTGEMLTLAQLSRASLHGFLTRHEVTFDWRRPGKLILYPTVTALGEAGETAAFQAGFGGKHAMLSAAEALEREPALRGGTRPIAGAIYLPDAELGDCRAFCEELARLLTGKLAGSIRFATRATRLVREGRRIRAVTTPKGEVGGDLFVIATGGAAAKLLPPFPGRKRIVGVRGVSLTLPAGPQAPALSVTDASGRFVVVRLGARVRASGFAAFGSQAAPRASEIALLTEKARALMPEAADYDAPPEAWSGQRPQTPDDLPMIGRAGAENLFVNAGHGSLGWTFAFGSAERLLTAIEHAGA